MNLINQTLLTICHQCQVEPIPLKTRKDFSQLLSAVFEKINSNPSFISNDQIVNTVTVLDQLTREKTIAHHWLEKALICRQGGDLFTIFVSGKPLYFSKSALEKVSDYFQGMAKFKSVDNISFDDRTEEEVAIPLKICLEDQPIPGGSSIELLWRCFDAAQYLSLTKALKVLAEELLQRCFHEKVSLSQNQLKLLIPHIRQLDLSHCPHLAHHTFALLRGAPIEELTVANNCLEEESFAVIGTLKRLKKLDLSDSPYFWYPSFKNLIGLTDLTHLNLSNASLIKDGKAYGQLGALPKLKQLVLKNNCPIPQETRQIFLEKPDFKLILK